MWRAACFLSVGMPSASLLRCSVAFALGIPIVACSDGDGVAPDAFPAVPSVVGTWRRIPNQLDAHPPPALPARPQLVYEIDGTLTFREVVRTRVYDYVIEADGTITATDRGDGTPHVETYQYRVSGDRYIDNVMTPQGMVVGAVGTWAVSRRGRGSSSTRPGAPRRPDCPPGVQSHRPGFVVLPRHLARRRRRRSRGRPARRSDHRCRVRHHR